jgi:hypothetical protein
MDDFITAGIFAVVFLCVYYFSRPPAIPVSYLAVFSVLTGLLNPILVRLILVHFHVSRYPWSFSSILRSVATADVALVIGFIALRRIRNSNGTLRGIALARAGIAAGILWLVLWAGLAVLIVKTLSHFDGPE